MTDPRVLGKLDQVEQHLSNLATKAQLEVIDAELAKEHRHTMSVDSRRVEALEAARGRALGRLRIPKARGRIEDA